MRRRRVTLNWRCSPTSWIENHAWFRVLPRIGETVWAQHYEGTERRYTHKVVGIVHYPHGITLELETVMPVAEERPSSASNVQKMVDPYEEAIRLKGAPPRWVMCVRCGLSRATCRCALDALADEPAASSHGRSAGE